MRTTGNAPTDRRRSAAATRARSGGFTVIELMIVLVVTAILLALATPNLRGTLARNQLLGQANELAGAMALARSEAVSRGLQAGVCASADGTACSGSDSDWSNFIVVFSDTDNDGTFDGTEPLLKSLASTDDVTWTANTDIFLFTPAGFSTQAALTNVDVCHEDLSENNRCRRITVQPSGIVSVTTVKP